MAYQVLLADDSATMQKVVQITFGNEDFQVTAVDNGQAAIATAKQLKPQVALVDVGMPGMDGYAVCQAIKADAETSGIAVVLLASNFTPIDEARAQSVGATAHVMKPFETQALIDRVKTILGQPVSAPIRSIPQATAAPAARPAAPATPPAATAAPSPAATAGFGGPGFGQPAARPAAPPAQPAAQPPRPAAPPASPFGAPPPRTAPPPAASPFSAGAAAPPQRTPPPAFGTPPGAAPQQARPAGPPAGAPPPRPFGAPPPAAPAARPAPPPAAPAAAAAKANEASFGDVQLDLGEDTFPSAPAAQRPAAPVHQARPPQTSFGTPQPTQSRDPFGLGQAKPPAAPAVAQAPAAPPAAPQVAQRPAAAAMPAELAGMNEDVIRQVAREVIERIAWEVVPELAETIIRQHLDKLIKDQRK